MAKGQPKKRKSRSDLPAPSKGRNLTDDEKIEVAKHVCELYKTDKYSLQTCLEASNIKSDSTWYSWINQIEEIANLYQAALKDKDKVYRGRLKERGRTSLERMVTGYVVTTKEIVYQWENTVDDKGVVTDRKKVIVAEKVKDVYVKPSPTLIQYVLNNLDSQNFERSPERIPVESDRVDIPRFKWLDDGEYTEYTEEDAAS